MLGAVLEQLLVGLQTIFKEIRMKNFSVYLFLCLIFVNLLFWIEVDTKQREVKYETEVRILRMEQTIEKQEKEIRLLKQDVDILQNGYRE